jgi:hypothetical protein
MQNVVLYILINEFGTAQLRGTDFWPTSRPVCLLSGTHFADPHSTGKSEKPGTANSMAQKVTILPDFPFPREVLQRNRHRGLFRHYTSPHIGRNGIRGILGASMCLNCAILAAWPASLFAAVLRLWPQYHTSRLFYLSLFVQRQGSSATFVDKAFDPQLTDFVQSAGFTVRSRLTTFGK